MAGINYATPAQADIKPMDFSIYMATQKAGAQAMQHNLEMQATFLEHDMQKAEQGSKALQGVTTALDQMKAYGKDDKEQLSQIRAGYGSRLKEIIGEGIEGGGLHTISGALRLESGRLSSELAKGELGDIGQRYGISQEHLKIANEIYSKGKMTDYDRYHTSLNLLNTPKESNDIIEEVTSLSNANSLKYTDVNQLGMEYVRLAKSMFPEDFAKMTMFDEATEGNSYANTINSLLNAAAVQHSNGSGLGSKGTMAGGMNAMGMGGTGYTPIVETNAGTISSRYLGGVFGTQDKVLNRINTELTDESLQSNLPKEQYTTQREADDDLATIAYQFSRLDPKQQPSISKGVLATISGSSVRSVTHGTTLDSQEIVKNLLDDDKYEDFTVVGVFGADNPHYPGGYAATAKNLEEGEQEFFIISGDRTGGTEDYYNNMIFKANRNLHNEERRFEGHQEEFYINVTDAGLKSTTDFYGTAEYKQEDAIVSGAIELVDVKDTDTGGKYKLVTQSRMVNIGGKSRWRIVADIINTETGDRVDISGTKGYSTLTETIGWLKSIYNDNLY